jgi:hypothetical protein
MTQSLDKVYQALFKTTFFSIQPWQDPRYGATTLD